MSTTNNPSNGGFPNAVPAGQLTLRPALSVQTADCDDLTLSKLGPWVALASEPGLPALGLAVGHVVQVGAEEQVGRPDAGWVIAGVQDVLIGPGAVLQEPRHPMGAAHLAVPAALPDGPVAVAAQSSGPEPATFSDADLGPEPLTQRCSFRHDPPYHKA